MMPRHIVKLERNGETRYMEWSTVVDAPVSDLMDLEAFRKHYRYYYGDHGMSELPERMARVDKFGTSAMNPPESAEALIAFNRAGPGESCLTVEELWNKYTYMEASDD